MVGEAKQIKSIADALSRNSGRVALAFMRARIGIVAAERAADEHPATLLGMALRDLEDVEQFLTDVADLMESVANDAEELKKNAESEKIKQQFFVETDVHHLCKPHIREAVWGLTDGHCAYCNKTLSQGGDRHSHDAFCIEHVVPRSKGGPDRLENYVPACRECNAAKQDKHVLTFIRRRMGAASMVTPERYQ